MLSKIVVGSIIVAMLGLALIPNAVRLIRTGYVDGIRKQSIDSLIWRGSFSGKKALWSGITHVLAGLIQLGLFGLGAYAAFIGKYEW